MQVIKPSIEIIDMEDYEKIVKKIERIGRVCYKSEGKITEDSAEKFIKGLLTRQHESVIEHENVTVRTASIVPSHFIFKRNPAVNTMVFGFKIHRKFFRNLVCVLWGNPDGNVVFFYVIRILRSLRLRRNQAEEQDKKATTSYII